MNHLQILFYFFAGLVSILLVSTIGAIASMKFNFKYSYLWIVSAFTYAGLGYLIARRADFTMVIVTCSVLGLIESTLGYYLSIISKANNGFTREENLKMIGVKTSVGMILFAIVFGLLGMYGYKKSLYL